MEIKNLIYVVVGSDKNGDATMMKFLIKCTEDQYYDQDDIAAISETTDEWHWQGELTIFDDMNQFTQNLFEANWIPVTSLDITNEVESDIGIFAGIPSRDLTDDEQAAFNSIFPERE